MTILFFCSILYLRSINTMMYRTKQALIEIYVNVALSFKGKKETIQIDIFHLRSNSSSRSFFFKVSLYYFFFLSSRHHQERRKTAHFFLLSLFILTILYSLSPSSSSSSLSYCGFFVHIYKYIYILYIRRTVTKVEPIYRTYLYNTVDMHTMLQFLCSLSLSVPYMTF